MKRRVWLFAVLLLAIALQAFATDPVPKGLIWDTPITGSSTAGVFTTAISVRTDSSSTTWRSAAWRITVQVGGTDSVVAVLATKAAKTTPLVLNTGTALTHGQTYTFTLGVNQGLTYNFAVNTTTTIDYLLIEECSSDGL